MKFWRFSVSRGLFEAMLMTAFPPIDPLDGVKPEFHKKSLEDFEENMTCLMQAGVLKHDLLARNMP